MRERIKKSILIIISTNKQTNKFNYFRAAGIKKYDGYEAQTVKRLETTIKIIEIVKEYNSWELNLLSTTLEGAPHSGRSLQ